VQTCLGAIAAGPLLWAGCGGNGDVGRAAGTGGSWGSGGHVGTGGLVGTGGFVGTGGLPGTGVSVGTGGVTGGGGSLGTGGGDGNACQFRMPSPPSTNLPNPRAYDYTSIPGVVIDQVTGLMWQRYVPGSSDVAHRDAQTYCTLNARGLGGFVDWRVPTVLELVSLVDYTIAFPGAAIDGEAFDTNASGQDFGSTWTSSPIAGSPGDFWNVRFRGGTVDPNDIVGPTAQLAVRCVRLACAPPSPRYQVESGLVTDMYTGLVWQQAASATSLSWADAMNYCKGLGGGFRVPSVNELQTIVDYGRPDPAIDTSIFPQFTGWTSSVYNTPSSIRVVGSDGSTGYTDAAITMPVRCVR